MGSYVPPKKRKVETQEVKQEEPKSGKEGLISESEADKNDKPIQDWNK